MTLDVVGLLLPGEPPALTLDVVGLLLPGDVATLTLSVVGLLPGQPAALALGVLGFLFAGEPRALALGVFGLRLLALLPLLVHVILLFHRPYCAFVQDGSGGRDLPQVATLFSV